MATSSDRKATRRLNPLLTSSKRPTISRNSSFASDFDEEYFSRTYVPLSNLPTPPLSLSPQRDSSSSSSVRPYEPPVDDLDPELLGHAVHLTNLIPSSLSLTAPSVPLLHEILKRAGLPKPVMALAVLIMDSLSPRFSLSFRTACPLMCGEAETEHADSRGARDHVQIPPTPPDEDLSPMPTTMGPHRRNPLAPRRPLHIPIHAMRSASQQHIDDISPTLLPLTALTIADKFTNDEQIGTANYLLEWCATPLWTCDQLNCCERCVLADLGYRVLGLWDGALVAETDGDIERAAATWIEGRRAVRDRWQSVVRHVDDGQAARETKRDRDVVEVEAEVVEAGSDPIGEA